MGESIMATCLAMCPEKERRLREREGLLHVFEMDDTTKHWKNPKADAKKIIKSYSRSGAGRMMTEDSNALRPGPVLLSTIEYLFTKIITRSDLDWLLTYEFIFDRLRAIRQDMIIQRMDISTSINILEPIVRFHIYAAQRLCERPIEEFIPKFNNQHLLECLKQLLVLYDERDLESKASFHEQRVQTEALYILLYLGNHTVLERGLSLPLKYRQSCEVQKALDISLAWYLKNYVRVCRGIMKLSPLLKMASLMNLPRIRRDTFEIMSLAYNSDILHFSGDKFRELLLYNNTEEISSDCEHFGVKFMNGDICFQKKKFNANKEMSCSRTAFSEETLQSLLPSIILK